MYKTSQMFAIKRQIHRYLSTQINRNVPATNEHFHKPIQKILIANRGEIACRVVKTARRLGIRTVAVYSDADENSLHVHMADEAHHIGPSPSQQSYLRGDKILATAKLSGCQAIHPGYGFLSESVEFAELCQKENIIFMGPPASAIRDMGIKSTSKSIMSAAGVPIINGYHGDDQSNERLISEAKKIGFPLMIKAVRGGGGKGMRIADTETVFMDALQSARTESEKAFGDSAMLLERYVRSPRHVEVQVFGDHYGNAVYLFERDCSVQRRHQKIIEEAPAPGLSENLREQLGTAAVRAAKAVGYVGAGTVEFILDKEDLSFHFMEMNTRLQVEHPITEMITGLDLVEWQIRVASGEPLPLKQTDIKRNGHSFEARIYAENPRGGFLPGAGPLNHLTTPISSDCVRIETGVRQGDEVSVHYDPMIAKLVVWGENRIQALDSLIARLGEYHIYGLDTNVNFLIDLANHKAFRAADVHTGFIPQHFDSLFPPESIHDNVLCQAVIALIENEYAAAEINGQRSSSFIKTIGNPFIIEHAMRLNHIGVRKFHLKFNNVEYSIAVKDVNGKYHVQINDSTIWKKIKVTQIPHQQRYKLNYNIDGVYTNCSVVISPEQVVIFNKNGKIELDIVQPKFLTEQSIGADGSAGNKIISPMPGVLDKILVNVGDVVKAGDSVAVIIAMKMEHVLKTHRSGTIKSIGGKSGDNMAKGAAVVTLDEEQQSNEKVV